MVLVEWEPDPDHGENVATQCWYLLDPSRKKWNAVSLTTRTAPGGCTLLSSQSEPRIGAKRRAIAENGCGG